MGFGGREGARKGVYMPHITMLFLILNGNPECQRTDLSWGLWSGQQKALWRKHQHLRVDHLGTDTCQWLWLYLSCTQSDKQITACIQDGLNFGSSSSVDTLFSSPVNKYILLLVWFRPAQSLTGHSVIHMVSVIPECRRETDRKVDTTVNSVILIFRTSLFLTCVMIQI